MKLLFETAVRNPRGSRYVLQFATGAPLKVQLPSISIAASGAVAPAGATGLPKRSTDGLLPLALLLSNPGQYLKIPAFAMSVIVNPLAWVRLRSRCPSNKAKKKV